ncbi:zinc-ribbon and DUF3426 domain-containing protein [Allopusillimonas ginsengisoli]|uniref:zinc-ribbon and DUF3426 domain-containing protein n=1 Tax=Allopusillimonas ginsengisoli TaxID=453575 RepID=UPI001430574A|nr:zinc-ribbon and DUF3426 domain-containing protein [Allopusillimonas ginsengisoli]
MDLTTRCPQCGTIFSASLEQLQLRKGYIRCISCAHIFDGFEAVVSGAGESAPVTGHEAPPAAPPVRQATAGGAAASLHAGQASPAPPGDPSIPRVVRHRHRTDAPSGPRHDASGAAPGHTLDSHRLVSSPGPAFTISSRSSADSQDDDSRFRVGEAVRPLRPEPGIKDERAAASAQVGRSHASAQGVDTSPSWSISARDEPHVDEASADAESSPAFYLDPKEAGQVARGRDPIGRDVSARTISDHARRPDHDIESYQESSSIATLFWRVMVALGAVLLLAQLAYVYRVQIANDVPLLRPVLEKACVSLGCQVPYARNINAITIMSSSLSSGVGITTDNPGDAGNKDAKSTATPGSLMLQLVMRNGYGKPQEWPTLALSLKDVAGTLLVRKNLPPDAYLPAEMLLHPFAANSEVTVRVPIMLNGQSINGYQLDKFFQ